MHFFFNLLQIDSKNAIMRSINVSHTGATIGNQMRVKPANSRLCSICYTLSQEILNPHFVQLFYIYKYFRAQTMFIHDVQKISKIYPLKCHF